MGGRSSGSGKGSSKAISISNTKNGWKAKQAKSGGNVSRSGMKGALDRTQGRK